MYESIFYCKSLARQLKNMLKVSFGVTDLEKEISEWTAVLNVEFPLSKYIFIGAIVFLSQGSQFWAGH